MLMAYMPFVGKGAVVMVTWTRSIDEPAPPNILLAFGLFRQIHLIPYPLDHIWAILIILWYGHCWLFYTTPFRLEQYRVQSSKWHIVTMMCSIPNRNLQSNTITCIGGRTLAMVVTTSFRMVAMQSFWWVSPVQLNRNSGWSLSGGYFSSKWTPYCM